MTTATLSAPTTDISTVDAPTTDRPQPTIPSKRTAPSGATVCAGENDRTRESTGTGEGTGTGSLAPGGGSLRQADEKTASRPRSHGSGTDHADAGGHDDGPCDDRPITEDSVTAADTRHIATQMVRACRCPARLGRLGEEYTAAILVRHGWRIIEHNYRTRYGEIDLLALTPAGLLAVVEVKTRSSLVTGLPVQAVTPAKQHRLRLAARQWLLEHPAGGRPMRFDVASIIVRAGRVLLDYREGAF